MEPIFTPWRLDYLLSDPGSAPDCIFCAALEADDDRGKLILRRLSEVFVILNLYPYNNGHLMIVFNRHLARLSEATAGERHQMMEATALCEGILQEAYRPHGINVGANLGRAAGAGVAGHLHLHVVPRWEGDTNFAAVLAGARIIPETPQQTYARLQPLLARAEIA